MRQALIVETTGKVMTLLVDTRKSGAYMTAVSGV
jgi:hypothetical protein